MGEAAHSTALQLLFLLLDDHHNYCANLGGGLTAALCSTQRAPELECRARGGTKTGTRAGVGAGARARAERELEWERKLERELERARMQEPNKDAEKIIVIGQL